LLSQHCFCKSAMTYFQNFWQTVEKARQKRNALWVRIGQGWKDGLTCFRGASSLMPRCVSRYADTAETEPQDGKLHEDRPLLNHRPSAGFVKRQALEKAETTVKRASSLGSSIGKKGRSASEGLRRRATDVARSIPSPCKTRTSRPLEKRAADDSIIYDSVSRSKDDDFADDGVFEIGSDDEEESVFDTHPQQSEALSTTLSAWGKPGECIDQLGELSSTLNCARQVAPAFQLGGFASHGGGMGKVNALNLGHLNPMRSPREAPTAFYVGTPRDDGFM